MATIVKTETGRWRAQVRIKGFPSVAQTFDKKGQAQTWADQTEAKMRNGGFSDARELANFTITAIVDRYIEEIGAIKPFGRSKMGALSMLKRFMGTVTLAALNDDAIVEYAKKRGSMGAGGVTIGLELTYLGGVLRIVRSVWKLPYHARPIDDARPTLKLLRLHTKSKERDRRPTQDEVDAICNHFASKARQRIPMPDIIRFAIATTMRASEITSLRWDDLNREDRTIMIRDRKHPEEKIGNNQIVPLLGEAYEIVMRQPERGDFIFPYKHHSFSSLFPRACTKLEIEDLHFHDLRHEGVSRLFEQGYRIEQVALVSGHRDWKMLRRYTQVRARDLHRDTIEPESEAA